tara:strand:+ start:72 stop:629 length:558 start_codon:yes stop_codon:yes gene_type:complete
MGTDVTQHLQIEQSLMEGSFNIGNVPETSFLDLLTALAVMPLAAFTTLAVLGGGSSTPPEWMRIGDEIPIKTVEEEGDGGAFVASGRIVGAVAGTAIGVGIGVAAAAASGVASKANVAANTAVAAANSAPQVVEGGMKSVESTGEVFSFVDNAAEVNSVASDLDLAGDSNESETSEFEGLGSMFD